MFLYMIFVVGISLGVPADFQERNNTYILRSLRSLDCTYLCYDEKADLRVVASAVIAWTVCGWLAKVDEIPPHFPLFSCTHTEFRRHHKS